MDNQGMQSDVKNDYPSQPAGQPYPAPEYGQPQPGYTYPSSSAYSANGTPPGNQQQQVVFVGGQPQGPIYFTQAPPIVSMVGAIVLSCVTFWLCGVLFGLIAFILASKSQRVFSHNIIQVFICYNYVDGTPLTGLHDYFSFQRNVLFTDEISMLRKRI